MRDHAYGWIEMDPDHRTVFCGHLAAYGGIAADTNDFRKLIGNGNYDYTFYVYHPPENVTLSAITMTAGTGMNCTTGADTVMGGMYIPTPGAYGGIGDEWNGHASANITIHLDVPHYDLTDPHFGQAGIHEWDIETTDFQDFDAEEREWVYDQRNWRTAAPLYDLRDDLQKEFSDDLDKITNAFVVRIVFNQTIDPIDTANTHVNFTLMERDFNSYNIETIISNDTLYCVFLRPEVWNNGYLLSFDIQLVFNTNFINCSTYLNGGGVYSRGAGIYSGRLVLTYDDAPIGAFTQLGNWFNILCN